MSNQDPLKRLVDIVNEQLKQGKSEEEVVDLLISSGLDDFKARNVVATVKASRTSHVGGVIRFMAVAIAALSVLTLTAYIMLGESQFLGQATSLTLIFFLCFILFGIMASIKGKIMVYARLVNAGFWLTSSFMLMVAMFLHPGWDSEWFGTGGGWRGKIFSLAGNVIYNIGPTGIAYILAVLSMLILLLFWSEIHRLKTQDYEAI
ncbi:hypothetical protein SAMN04488490_1130 [Marinobacter sp. LV10R510-11A]|uniref:hypothetical protein n=1 Tax=Marinobacter sp. LV10R510-11A TaxID=1415568 RepID=UPI000BB7B53D|nr:hypothetical protein [Marinobacter sp. LV10R510-11A]SOB75523.1 hypothetical protein SAMN04488490_1130 [Marinobacter sp. LV10R510-11A]